MNGEFNYSDAFLCTLKRSKEVITTPILKLGGSPVFYEDIEWPKCEWCGQEMEFLAQIPLDAPLPFSKRFSLAYVFMCPGYTDENGWLICQTWDPASGANKVFLQEKSNHSYIYTHTSEYPDFIVSLEPVREAIIDTSREFNIPNEIRESVNEQTKLGGVPSWLQDNDTPQCPVCNGPMKFVAQFAAGLDVHLPGDPSERNKDKYKFFHFGGDDGIGYLFVCEIDCSQEGACFLWQCT